MKLAQSAFCTMGGGHRALLIVNLTKATYEQVTKLS